MMLNTKLLATCMALILFMFFDNTCVGAPIRADRAIELHVSTIGMRALGKAKIPAFSIDTQTGLDLAEADRVLYPLPPMNDIPPLLATQVSWIHVTGYGWLLIPRGWTVVDGGVGADGSMALVASSKSGDSWLEYSDMGACVGCAVGAASCYYPQAQKYAQELEMGQCEKRDSPNPQSPRTPSMHYARAQTSGANEQVLRRYLDADGYIRFHQLTLHSLDVKETDMRAEALGLFFTQIWAPGNG
jgi:hypothetical protein